MEVGIILFSGTCVFSALRAKYNKMHAAISQVGISHKYTSCAELSKCIYLDYNATTPIFAEVAEAMEPYLWKCFGNPSSPHVFGKPCHDAVEAARAQVAVLIGANDPRRIIFTSCGSESDNRAIDIALRHYATSTAPRLDADGTLPLPHIITSAIEHPAILNYLRALYKEGRIDLSIISVSTTGVVDVETLLRSLRPTTALVTLMHSNNEVGTLQPIRAIAESIRAYNRLHHCDILFHSDAAQSMGKGLPVDCRTLGGVDMLTLVGHKFGAPKGIAVLYVAPYVRLNPLLYGGGQEHGFRAGTENVMLIVALGAAARIAIREQMEMFKHLLQLRVRFLNCLRRRLSSANMDLCRFNGVPLAYDTSHLTNILSAIGCPSDYLLLAEHFPSLPNTVSVSFRGLRTATLMPQLLTKVACSAGAACHSSEKDLQCLSYVLEAMQVPMEYGLGTLRISFGRHTTLCEVERAAEFIADTVMAAATSVK